MTANPEPDADRVAQEQDRAAMGRLTAGQDTALNDLMDRHAQRLFQYLLRLLQNETEAGDLAQEAFVRVYQHRARFRANSKFSTWLYAIATNLARDLQRRRARHPQVSLEAQHPETGDDFHECLPTNQPDPGQVVVATERAAAVRAAVAALPEELRLPLVLAEYEDRSHAEIGEILDCSSKAVEMRLYRARQQLRTHLAKVFEKI